MTPQEAALRGRLGAAVQRARHDPVDYTARARDAAWQRFVQQVDPQGTLPEPERLARARAAQRAHLLRAAVASARARRRGAGG